MNNSLASGFRDFGKWREDVSSDVGRLRAWLDSAGLQDAATAARLDAVLERLRDERLTIAFVAEFSRGKSELINAIFFADYGRRLLPSSSGRTTMCPTELMWDARLPPQMMLLPIETRADATPISELKRRPDAWHTTALDVTSGEALARSFQRVRETRLVSASDARALGLFVQGETPAGPPPRADGLVEVPAWRHAIVNFPHPLLAQGLVILDTPGLNAIGTEPELTLNLLPNAHAVLFILAADTGVSQSDLTAWRDYVLPAAGRDHFRFAVLNKIDGLWDGLRTEIEIEAETRQQLAYVGHTLGIDPAMVFPVSAQKGLIGRIGGDLALLERSRLPALEDALSSTILPRRRRLIQDATRDDVVATLGGARAVLESRRRSAAEELVQLASLRGRNLDVVAAMVERVRDEKQAFEQSLVAFQTARSRFTTLSDGLFRQLSMEALAEDAKRTLIEVRRSTFTPGVRAAMADYFHGCRARLDEAASRAEEIHTSMTATYADFQERYGLRLEEPPMLGVTRYRKEFERLERLYERHFDTLYAMLTNEALTLLHKFFETIATQIRKVFLYANREADAWLAGLVAPLEGQIRERQMQLRRRLDSIRRIHESTSTLDERVEAAQRELDRLTALQEDLARLSADIERTLGEGVDDAPPLEEAA
jgi:hypothetical protein